MTRTVSASIFRYFQSGNLAYAVFLDLPHNSIINEGRQTRPIGRNVLLRKAIFSENDNQETAIWRCGPIKPAVDSKRLFFVFGRLLRPRWVVRGIENVKDFEVVRINASEVIHHHTAAVPVCDAQFNRIFFPIPEQDELRIRISNDKVGLTFGFSNLLSKGADRHNCRNQCAGSRSPAANRAHPCLNGAGVLPASIPALPGDEFWQEPHHQHKCNQRQRRRNRDAKPLIRHFKALAETCATTHDSVQGCNTGGLA